MDYKQKLKNCRTCAEAQPILETLKVRPSQRKLIETAIQLRQSNDNRQVSYGEDFLITALREIDDDKLNGNHKNGTGNHQEATNNNDDGIKEDNGGSHRPQGGDKDLDDMIKNGEKEADEITPPLDSHQSSDLDMPYPKEGTDTPNSDIEGMQSASGENQMGGVRENMNGFPMGNGMPPMAPDVQQQMQPKMPPMPQMNTGQMMRQMQYTVESNLKRYLTPVIRETKKLRSAYIALDKKIQESQSQAGTMKLDLSSIKANATAREHVRETIGDMEIPVPKIDFIRAETSDARTKIAEMDKELSKHLSQPYQ